MPGTEAVNVSAIRRMSGDRGRHILVGVRRGAGAALDSPPVGREARARDPGSGQTQYDPEAIRAVCPKSNDQTADDSAIRCGVGVYMCAHSQATRSGLAIDGPQLNAEPTFLIGRRREHVERLGVIERAILILSGQGAQ